MNIKELYMPFKGYKTYIRIVGDGYTKPPLLLLHGGPGSTHNSFELLDDLSIKDKRPIIMYDQIGCGLSPCDDENLLNPDIWVKELEEVIKFLKLGKVHIMGHSWGGMLLIIYMCDKKRDGILSITLSSTLSSSSLWESESRKLIDKMNEEDKRIIYKAIEDNDFKSDEFKEVLDKYYYLYVFDKPNEESPECLRRVKPKTKSYSAWGPCEFMPQGILKDYEYTEKLKNINVPTLILSREKDESTPLQNEVLYNNISNYKEKYLFKNARHLTYYDSHDEYEDVLMKFLNKFDS